MKNETNTPEVVAKPSMVRGGCLTVFLVVMIIANAGVALLYFLNPGQVTQQFPRLSQGLLLLLGIGGLLNIVLAILVWRWHRVGVYGYAAVALLVFPINLYAGLPLVQAIIGLLGPMILGFLVKPRWARFA